MRRLLHAFISVLSWALVVVLGTFGIYFSFANYPVFAVVLTLSIVVLVAHSERHRRRRRRAADRVRSQRRARSHEPLA